LTADAKVRDREGDVRKAYTVDRVNIKGKMLQGDVKRRPTDGGKGYSYINTKNEFLL
jgi:hypothetical protein